MKREGDAVGFAQWVEDWRWAMNVKRARAWRRRLMFSERQRFDAALRPQTETTFDRPAEIAYPDAFYHVKIGDLIRAMGASRGRP